MGPIEVKGTLISETLLEWRAVSALTLSWPANRLNKAFSLCYEAMANEGRERSSAKASSPAKASEPGKGAGKAEQKGKGQKGKDQKGKEEKGKRKGKGEEEPPRHTLQHEKHFPETTCSAAHPRADLHH